MLNRNSDTNVFDNTLSSIEDIYTKKALTFCNREGDDILIPQIIKILKSKVYMLAVSPMSDKEKNDNLSDMVDFIDQDLLVHSKLVNVFNEFIRTEFKYISEAKKNKEYLPIERKKEIIETLEFQDNSHIKDAIKIIQLYGKFIIKEQKKIKNAKKIIQDIESMLDNNNETSLLVAQEMARNEEKTILDSHKAIELAKGKIIKAKKIIKEESLKQTLTELYIQKIIVFFDNEEDQQLAINSINFIVGRIKTIVESNNIDLERKKELLSKQIELIDPFFLNNNGQAFKILKEFIKLKCKEELINS